MNPIDTNTGKSIKNRNLIKRFGSAFALGAKKVGRIIVGRTLPQKLFRLYLIIIVAGALFLCAPFCLNKIQVEPDKWVQLNGFKNVHGYGFVQALFIACSGFSDTGLTPVNIYEYLNPGGQVVLLVLIEIGGIGVVALFYYVWNFFKKKEDKIDVGQLYIMQAERGGSKLAQSFHVIKVALIFILSTQVVFMFSYALCFCFIPAYKQQFINDAGELWDSPYFQGISFNTDQMLPMYHNFGWSLWIGLFTTISAMNNAGFDNISSTSMAPFRNDIGIFFQALIIIELIIGGLGHFVWFDVIEKIKCKATGKRYKMTLYTKVAISVYIIVAGFGLLGTFLGEFYAPRAASTLPIQEGVDYLVKDLTIIGNRNLHGEFGKNPMLNKCFAIIFQTFNCRSLGMETVKTNVFCNGTKWILVILMFIGASPCSTAGGIRTTTLAIIFVTIWCKLCGRKNVFFFKRRIQQDTVTQAFMIFIIALVLLLLGAVILRSATPIPPGQEYIEQYPDTWFSFGEYMVECASAFGTVGLSAGITAVTKWWGLLYLVILMFVGQLGVINTLLSWTRFHPHFNDIEYPYEDIKIG